MLEVVDLSVQFADIQALDHTSLEVPEGGVMAVMGPSGCGKTTLLRVIAGLQAPDKGSVTWQGRRLDGLAPHQRGIGLMFQDYALFPHRTVAGNVRFGLEMAGLDRAAAGHRVHEVLEMVGLTGYEDRHISELSGGEQQRVALARTLAPSPELVMLDEPIGSLDRNLRDQLMGDMRDLFSSLALTVLYVTHDQEEAFAVADRVAVMDRGRVLRSGTPEELWTDPGSAFVARFIGLDNLITAVVHRGTISVGGAGVPVAGSDGPHTFVIPMDAIELNRAGPASFTVERVAYAGGKYKVTLRSGELVLEAESLQRLEPGRTVGGRIEADRVVPLDQPTSSDV
jgi:thiamine transport system ATP-binding protein